MKKYNVKISVSFSTNLGTISNINIGKKSIMFNIGTMTAKGKDGEIQLKFDNRHYNYIINDILNTLENGMKIEIQYKDFTPNFN